MNRHDRRALVAATRRKNDHGDERLSPVPREEWGEELFDHPAVAVFKSRRFLVQIFQELDGVIRLSVCRTTINVDGSWRAGISWDDLYRVKSELGYGDRYAIEVYPRERDLVNVANMRHLWILPEPLGIGWFADR